MGRSKLLLGKHYPPSPELHPLACARLGVCLRILQCSSDLVCRPRILQNVEVLQFRLLHFFFLLVLNAGALNSLSGLPWPQTLAFQTEPLHPASGLALLWMLEGKTVEQKGSGFIRLTTLVGCVFVCLLYLYPSQVRMCQVVKVVYGEGDTVLHNAVRKSLST